MEKIGFIMAVVAAAALASVDLQTAVANAHGAISPDA
jgi:hypothetical protein